MRDSSTPVPELMGALTALVRRVLPDTWVHLGPPGAADVPACAVIVGYHDQQPAVQVQVSRADGYGARLVETIAVGCGLAVSSGGSDFAGLFVDARRMLAALTEGLKADVSVGGTVDLATLGPDVTWVTTATPQGSDVTVWFTVAAQVAL